MTEQLPSHRRLSVCSFPVVFPLLDNLHAVDECESQRNFRSRNSKELMLQEPTGNLLKANSFLLESAPTGPRGLTLSDAGQDHQRGVKRCSLRGLNHYSLQRSAIYQSWLPKWQLPSITFPSPSSLKLNLLTLFPPSFPHGFLEEIAPPGIDQAVTSRRVKLRTGSQYLAACAAALSWGKDTGRQAALQAIQPSCSQGFPTMGDALRHLVVIKFA